MKPAASISISRSLFYALLGLSIHPCSLGVHFSNAFIFLSQHVSKPCATLVCIHDLSALFVVWPTATKTEINATLWVGPTWLGLTLPTYFRLGRRHVWAISRNAVWHLSNRLQIVVSDCDCKFLLEQEYTFHPLIHSHNGSYCVISHTF